MSGRAEQQRAQWRAAGTEASAKRRREATHCKRGHEYTPENTRIEGGGRVCKTCSNQLQRDAWHRRTAIARGIRQATFERTFPSSSRLGRPK